MVSRTVVGQALLEVGRPEGLVAVGPARDPGPGDASAVASAVRTRSDPGPPTGGLDEADRILSSGQDVTSGVDAHVAALERQQPALEAVAAGRAGEPPELARELDVLTALLIRLARDGRRAELIRTVRAVEPALILSRRWPDVAAALQRTVEAGRALPDPAAEAWALHELGTLAAAGGEVSRGGSWLREALNQRQALGDAAGAAITKQNLAVLAAPAGATVVQTVDRGPAAAVVPAPAGGPPGGGLAWPWVILCLVLIGLAGGAAGWAVGQSSSSSTTVTSTTTGTGSTSTVTTSETTTERVTTTEQVTTTETVPTTVTTTTSTGP